MKHRHEFYQKQITDKSTVYDSSTEDPQDHPNFPKPKDKWVNVIVVPLLIWLGLGFIEAKYNIAQGDLKPHTWELMNAATAVLLLYWSVIFGTICWATESKNKAIRVFSQSMAIIFLATMIISGLYLFKISVEFIINFFN